ncbi:MAG TPA: PQQ-binding-like beta-propeller repeat protein, partial [Planctomycetota bacterium]|nr:PQQ-binding-like beta-propeller repeat protein [Planctomycetota bacterium]
ATVTQQRTVAPERAWMAPLGELRHAALLHVGPVGDLLLAEDDRGGLTALDPESGTPRWFVQLPALLTSWPVPGDRHLALACGADVVVVVAATGTRVCTVSSSSIPANSPTADEHALYVPTLLRDRLVATDLDTGAQSWEYQLSAPIATPAQLIGPAGTRSVLVGCDDGVLRALPTGRSVPEAERWAVHVGPILDRPMIAGGRVFVASRERVLTALDESSGVVLWTHLPGERLRGAPVVVGDLVVFGTGTRLVALHAENGRPAWEQASTSMPLAELQGALVCTCAADGSSELRDAATGIAYPRHLPGNVASSHGLLMELRGGAEIVAWKIAH